MSPALHDEMVAHALTGFPLEACGLLVGEPSGVLHSFHPVTNAAASSKLYTVDPRDMLKVDMAAEDAGLAVIGVMHSHTHTDPYPSPTDVEDAARFDPFGSWRFVIVSLQHPDPSLRAYRILDGRITEEIVRIV
jgi:proteasome lid subunit RPN8/RPN11